MAVDTLARAIAAGKVPVTAYEYAVQKGYTGTEEEFATDMGNSATNATNAATSASEAAASAASAVAAATNFAPAYSSSATYAVGDHVLYEGGYYVCNTAITTAEAWTAAHWTATKVGPEITELKTQINNADNLLEDVIEISNSLYSRADVTADKYIKGDGDFNTDSTWNISAEMDISDPDIVYGYKGFDYYGISVAYAAYYDSSHNFIETVSRAEGNDITILHNIPTNAKYVRFSIKDNDLDNFNFGIVKIFTPRKIDQLTNELKSTEAVLSEICGIKTNLYLKANITPDVYIRANGTTNTDPSVAGTWNITEEIAILESSKMYGYKGLGDYGLSLAYGAYYDSEHSFITSFQRVDGNNITILQDIPINAAYVRFSLKDDDLDNFVFGALETVVQDDITSINNTVKTTNSLLSDIADIGTSLYVKANNTPDVYIRANGIMNTDPSVAGTWNITEEIAINQAENLYGYKGFGDAGLSITYAAYYDSNHTFISSFQRVEGNDITVLLNIPVDAAYVRFSIKDDDLDSFNFGILKLSVNPLKNKKIAWFGDSIVHGDGFDQMVCQTLQMEEYDYGVNGATFAANSDNRTTMEEEWAEMISDGITPDIIAVSAGTNDFQYSVSPAGSIDLLANGTYDNTTFYGAIAKLLDTIIAAYPSALIFFTTPIKRAQKFTGSDNWTNPFSKNDNNLTLMQYADIIKEVCGYYSIPVCDLNRESGLNPQMASQASFFDDVKTHPTATGKMMMARRLSGWLKQLAGYWE